MTLAEILFKPFVPPVGVVMTSRVHLIDGCAEPERYRPSPSVSQHLNKRREMVRAAEERVMAFIRRNPASTREQIATGLGMSSNRMAERLISLVERGLIERQGQCMSRRGGPKTYRYWISQRGKSYQ